MLGIIAPLMSLIAMVIGMAHQINIILEVGQEGLTREDITRRLDILSIPRILLGIATSIVWIFYGLQINNHSISSLNFLAVILNICLIAVIRKVKKRVPPPR